MWNWWNMSAPFVTERVKVNVRWLPLFLHLRLCIQPKISQTFDYGGNVVWIVPGVQIKDLSIWASLHVNSKHSCFGKAGVKHVHEGRCLFKSAAWFFTNAPAGIRIRRIFICHQSSFLGESSLVGRLLASENSPSLLSLRGRPSTGKEKGIKARDHARGRSPTSSRAPKFPLSLPLLTPATQASLSSLLFFNMKCIFFSNLQQWNYSKFTSACWPWKFQW